MADFMVGMNMNPFLIFPVEVWELILDEVEDSQDAWNLLKAFPQLDASAALQKKKRFWLFGLVIPHLLPRRRSCWITGKELLNCRQVCRTWSSAVDGFLESQPLLRAYHPESDGPAAQLVGTGRFPWEWDVKAYLGRLDVDNVVPFGGVFFEIFKYCISTTRAGLPTTQRFLRDMEAHPPGRSPFVSRELSISSLREGYDSEEKKRTDFGEDILAIHRKFGKHVWFYTVNVGSWGRLGMSLVAGSLGYFPNLKMLDVFGGTIRGRDNEVDSQLVKQLGEDLPALPFLETLGLEGCPRQVSHSLISHLAAQIRRLDLHLSLWRDKYSVLFPNLTEFDINIRCMALDGNVLKNLLHSLEAPQLSKLQVKFPDVYGGRLGPCPLLIEDDVFQWLKRFPNMKFLDLGFGCRAFHFIERGTLDPLKDMATSLQFLAIQTSFEMHYNFLRCLPSLQHLQLHKSKPFVIDLSSNPVVKIREEIQTASMFQSNIWKLLPKLKAVAFVAEDDDVESGSPRNSFSYSFNRERYEVERRRNNGLTVCNGDDEDALAPLRQDITDFLKDSWKRWKKWIGIWNEEDESDLDGDLNHEGEDNVEVEENLVDEDDNE